MTEPHFSLVVLCYRSGKNIIPFVERLQRTLARCNFSSELVLVGNYIEGSNDETPQVVKELADGLDNIRTVIRPKQGMMGWDMRMGLDAARGTYIGVIDGDGQFPPESIDNSDVENIPRHSRRRSVSTPHLDSVQRNLQPAVRIQSSRHQLQT